MHELLPCRYLTLCDISKAFERVWHKGLPNKLENIGIQGSLLLWITNYLTDRKQRVVIESAHSKWRTIKAGIIYLTRIIFLKDWSDICQLPLCRESTS
jgi:hypothetical protein